MKFRQLILGKIIKIVDTICQILRLKCTKNDFGWSSAPYFAGPIYPQDLPVTPCLKEMDSPPSQRLLRGDSMSLTQGVSGQNTKMPIKVKCQG